MGKLAKDIAEAVAIHVADTGHGYLFELEPIIAQNLKSVALAFHTINRLDKTPDYGYGQVAPNGDLPPAGDRWITPREKAVAMLTLF